MHETLWLFYEWMFVIALMCFPLKMIQQRENLQKGVEERKYK